MGLPSAHKQLSNIELWMDWANAFEALPLLRTEDLQDESVSTLALDLQSVDNSTHLCCFYQFQQDFQVTQKPIQSHTCLIVHIYGY